MTSQHEIRHGSVDPQLYTASKEGQTPVFHDLQKQAHKRILSSNNYGTGGQENFNNNIF